MLSIFLPNLSVHFGKIHECQEDSSLIKIYSIIKKVYDTACANGKSTIKVEPFPNSLSIRTLPLCASTILFT